MKLICGLGNPGPEYTDDRHNIGFRVLDALGARLSAPFSTRKFQGEVAQGALKNERLVLLKPQTFMNLSGTSVAACARFYKVSPGDALVVHDELDLPFGRLQLKVGGGAGGHNGLRSIMEHWGEDGFARLRFGVGKPANVAASRERVVAHVLSGFGPEERAELPGLVDRALEACELWARVGPGPAMNAVNRRSPPPAKG